MIFLKFWVSILVVLRVAHPASAQTSHQLGAEVGWQRYLTHEPILSPLRYGGAYLTMRLSYAYISDQHIHQGQIARGTGELASSITDTNEWGQHHYLDFLSWQLQYTYLRRIRAFSRIWLYGGGTLQAAYFSKELTYLLDYDGRSADVFIAPATTLAMSTNAHQKHQVRGLISIAPLAYVAARTYAGNRPPLSLLDKELTVVNALRYGDLLAIPRFVHVRGELAYQYHFASHWSAYLTYQWQHYSYDKLDPFAVRSVVHTLFTGISVHL